MHVEDQIVQQARTHRIETQSDSSKNTIDGSSPEHGRIGPLPHSTGDLVRQLSCAPCQTHLIQTPGHALPDSSSDLSVCLRNGNAVLS